MTRASGYKKASVGRQMALSALVSWNNTFKVFLQLLHGICPAKAAMSTRYDFGFLSVCDQKKSVSQIRAPLPPLLQESMQAKSHVQNHIAHLRCFCRVLDGYKLLLLPPRSLAMLCAPSFSNSKGRLIVGMCLLCVGLQDFKIGDSCSAVLCAEKHQIRTSVPACGLLESADSISAYLPSLKVLSSAQPPRLRISKMRSEQRMRFISPKSTEYRVMCFLLSAPRVCRANRCSREWRSRQHIQT